MPDTDIRSTLPRINQISKENLSKKCKSSPDLPTGALLAERADGLEFRFDLLENAGSVRARAH
jgi:hypothetical protein